LITSFPLIGVLPTVFTLSFKNHTGKVFCQGEKK
jgi:hypothetical protein